MNKQGILEHFATTGMHKQAGAIGDKAGEIIWGGIPYLGPAANGIGSLHGLTNDASDADVAKMNENAALSALPGVGASRGMRRLKRVTKDKAGHNSKLLAQMIGPATSAVLPALAGAGIGGAISGKDNGAVAGALIGGTLPPVVAMLAALISKRRTKEEQAAYVEGSDLPDYLVPGLATYNYWKSYGRAVAEGEEKPEAAEEPAEKAEKKEAALRQRIASLYA